MLVTHILTLFADDVVSESNDTFMNCQLQQLLQPPDALPVMLQDCLIRTYGHRFHACLLTHVWISCITYSSSAGHLGNSLILIAQILLDTDNGHLVTFIATWKYLYRLIHFMLSHSFKPSFGAGNLIHLSYILLVQLSIILHKVWCLEKN